MDTEPTWVGVVREVIRFGYFVLVPLSIGFVLFTTIVGIHRILETCGCSPF